LRVPFDPADPGTCAVEFHSMHRSRYGHADARSPVEAVLLRYVLSGEPQIPPLQFPTASSPGAPIRMSRVHDGSAWTSAQVFMRDDLAAGQRLDGPVLILQSDSTTFVPSAWAGGVDAQGNLRLTPDNLRAD